MIIELNENQKLESLLKYKSTLLVVFYSNSCGYCKKLLPVLDEIDASGKFSDKLKIIKVDTTVHKDISSAHQVAGIPAMFFYKDEKVIAQTKGYREKDAMEKTIEEVIKTGKLASQPQPQQPQQRQGGGCGGGNGECGCGGKFDISTEFGKNKEFLTKLFEESGKDPKQFINNLSSMLTGVLLGRK